MSSDVLKVDYMVKRSQMKSKLFQQGNYKSRWFKLTSQCLYYCEGKFEVGCGKVKGQILLNSVVAVENAESEPLGNRPHAFQVVYRRPEAYDELCTLYIMAHTAELKDGWIEAIRSACGDCGAQFVKKYHPGVWLDKAAKYSCCDGIIKRSYGCVPVTFKPNQRRNSADAGSGSSSSTTTVAATEPKTNKIIKNAANSSRDEPTSRVVALYAYSSQSDDTLSLVKGDEYELLEEYNERGWLRARSKDGSVGLIPANFVQLADSENLEQYDWFYGNASRTHSETILEKDGREGCFMVRESSKPGVYTLSILVAAVENGCKTAVPKHYHIRRTSGKYCVSESHQFDTIQELIYYHKLNAGGLITRLRFPPADKDKPTLSIDAKEINKADLQIKERLGAGNFGEVRRAIYNHEIEVAVKTMKPDTMSEDDFLDEAKVMVNLRHNNLVRLYGVCTRQRPLMIITEFMRNGALINYLKRHRQFLSRKPSQLLDMCSQVCSAMEYLEYNGFIHRDLAARNCLVGENNVVKVADFGMARFVLDDEYRSSYGTKYPIKWAAPEVINLTRFSSKSDVWAFGHSKSYENGIIRNGVLVWEVFTFGETPYADVKNADVANVVCEQRRRLDQPEHCPDAVYNIAVSCWNFEADKRPTFSQLASSLRDLIERDYVL